MMDSSNEIVLIFVSLSRALWLLLFFFSFFFFFFFFVLFNVLLLLCLCFQKCIWYYLIQDIIFSTSCVLHDKIQEVMISRIKRSSGFSGSLDRINVIHRYYEELFIISQEVINRNMLT